MTLSNLLTKITILLSLMAFSPARSQTPATFDESQIVNSAKLQLNALVKDGAELSNYFKKNNVSGEFTFDITLQGKGDVITVFLVSSTNESTQENNLVKDKLHALKFNDIKIPKHERVKFRHTISI